MTATGSARKAPRATRPALVPNKPKNPMLGWRPPAALSTWARDEAARRSVPLKVILDEALNEYRERHGDPSCPHPPKRINKGLCGRCGTHVG